MKQNSKNYRKLSFILFGIMFIVFACQKENIREEYIESNTIPFKVSVISLNDFGIRRKYKAV